MMRLGGLRIPAPRSMLLVAVVLLLTGCYLPVRFDAEIEITRYGTYNLIFDGYMVSVPLYDGLRKNDIKTAEEKEKVEVSAAT